MRLTPTLNLRFTFRTLLSIGFCLLMVGQALAQFNTATQNGVINAGEYGTHVNGQNQQTDGGTTYFMSWDASNLYVAFTGTNYNEPAILYLDVDPQIPVNGGTNANGSLQGLYTYERNHMRQPFRADFVLYYKNGYHEFRYDDGAGYWNGATSNTLAVGSNGGTNTVEIAIPWNTITSGGGRPAAFNWFTYKAYDYGPGTNGIYNFLPVGNPNCACNQDPSTSYPTRYYNVLNTANGSSTRPFSTVSFIYYQDFSVAGTGGYYQNGGTFHDFTINDNSANNNDNGAAFQAYDNNEISNRVLIDGAITVANYLYVGQGSALLPANNTPGAVTATLTMNGSAGRIYNYGRIDPNPEAANFGDWNNRRINFVFAGATTLMPSNIFKDLWRISNVTINAGASLLGPSVDSVSLEMQWGTLANLGTINLGNGSAGFADLGTRGDWSQQNDYFFQGSGLWRVHQILIGRNSSRLLPTFNGAPVRLQVQGDFENYDEFLGRNGSGRIDVVMAGNRRQYLRGNTTETTGAATSFYNLEINNANGLNNNNNTADVWMQSFGGGTIDYFVTGQLTLTNGDLVTRDRGSNLVHRFTMRDSAAVNLTAARGNIGLDGSSFVDGPMRWEIENAALVTRQFPVGKTKTVTGYALGDYRKVQLEMDLDAAAKTTFQAEMFLDDRSATYTWPIPVPETIAWISQQRYWNVSKVAGANVQNAFVTLDYDVIERHDGVNNAPALRIVKDDGAGNWINLTPLGPGGTANGTGSIRSFNFNSFSDFTLASVDGNQPLPLDLLGFEAILVGDMVRLDWQTGSEINTDVFVLECSNNRSQFHEIGRVEAAGNSTAPSQYRYWDAHPDLNQDLLYYRLKMVDNDGAFQYSAVRTVAIHANLEPQILIYPNPSHGQVTLALSGLNELINNEIEILDALGRLVYRTTLDRNAERMQLDLGHLAAGTYALRMSSPKGPILCRLVLQ